VSLVNAPLAIAAVLALRAQQAEHRKNCQLYRESICNFVTHLLGCPDLQATIWPERCLGHFSADKSALAAAAFYALMYDKDVLTDELRLALGELFDMVRECYVLAQKLPFTWDVFNVYGWMESIEVTPGQQQIFRELLEQFRTHKLDT
jgi:hypothetical protein